MAASGTGIPLSGGTGMDAFDQGFKTMQSAIDSIRQNQYRTGTLAVAQQELQQKQTMLPAMLQKYADEHELNPYQRDLLKAQANEAVARANKEGASSGILNEFMKSLHDGTPSNQNPTPKVENTGEGNYGIKDSNKAHFGNPNATQGGDEGLINVNAQGGIIDPRAQEHPPINAAQANAPSANPMNMPNNPDTIQNSSLMPDNEAQQNPDDNAPALPPRIANAASQQLTNPNAQAAPNGQTGQIQDNQQLTQEKKYPTKIGETVVIQKPIRSTKWDNFPKMEGLPDFTPKKETIADGVVRTTYPGSGMITLTKEAPSFEEKQEIAQKNRSDLAYQQEKARADLQDERQSKQEHQQALKEGDKIVAETRPIVDTIDLLKRAIKIQEDNPNSTGWVKGAEGRTGLSQDKATSALNEIFGKIQAATAHLGGRQGGVGTLNWADRIKASTFKSPEWNLANLREGLAEAENQVATRKDLYETRTKEKFPLGSSGKHFVVNPKTGLLEEK